MAKKTGMSFPVTLFHKDNGDPAFAQDARHSHHSEYPIVVTSQEDYDRLGPGWFDNPVDAAAWVNPEAPVAEPDVLGAGVGDDAPERGRQPEPPPDAVQASALLDASVGDVTEQVEEMNSVEFLHLLAQVETTGKNRKGVHSAIAARLETLAQS